MAKMRVEVVNRECVLWIPLRDGNPKGWRLSCGDDISAPDRLRADLNAIAPGCVEMPPDPPMTVALADKMLADYMLNDDHQDPTWCDKLIAQCRRARGV